MQTTGLRSEQPQSSAGPMGWLWGTGASPWGSPGHHCPATDNPHQPRPARRSSKVVGKQHQALTSSIHFVLHIQLPAPPPSSLLCTPSSPPHCSATFSSLLRFLLSLHQENSPFLLITRNSTSFAVQLKLHETPPYGSKTHQSFLPKRTVPCRRGQMVAGVREKP